MKAKRQVVNQKKSFEPFEVVITVESEEEARGLYAIFNRTHNLVVLPERIAQEIRDAIGRQYHSMKQITEEVSYDDYYQGYPEKYKSYL